VAQEARVFTAGTRRAAADGGPTLRAELFFEDASGALHSLVAAELPGDDDRWRELRAEVPAEAGRLHLLARHASSALAGDAGARVVWGAPRVRSAARPSDRPDIVLLTVDTLRAGADFEEMAPQLRTLLERGIYWPRAVAPSNWTLPAYASLLTGLDAGEHGAGRADFPAEPGKRPDYTALHADMRTVVEALQDAGWATCMVHQNPFLEPWSGMSRGFERYLRVVDDPAAGADATRAWWQAQAHRPRLLVVHLMTPHLPYDAAGKEGVEALPVNPLEALAYQEFLAGDHSVEERRAFFDFPEDARAAVRQHYRAEVGRVDRAVSDWLLPLVETGFASPQGLLFALHADHGEELWEDGGFEHGHSFDDSVIRVPLGLVWPERLEPEVRDEPAAAHLLGVELLHLLGVEDSLSDRQGLADRGVLDRCLLHDPPDEVNTSHPLYRATRGGRVFPRDAPPRDLPFTRRGSGGPVPSLRADVARRLAELGYAGD
jgi:hypothetical protein